MTLARRRERHVRIGAGLVRKELARFRGKEIKKVGDGFVATIDGPGRAVGR